MRPRSIVGPILLIGIGVLFLLHNLWPDIAMFDMFTRYWPFLLILWGLVRLVEVLFWAGKKGTVPVTGVSGGEWGLVVLVCLVGSLLFWGSRWAPHWTNHRLTVRGLEIFGERYDFPVTGEKQAGRTPRVVIELGRGNAKISGIDTDMVKVSGRKTIHAFDQADADKGDKQTPLEIVSMGDHVIIRTNQDKLDSSRKATADIEITVPRGASIEGRGRFGDFDIHDIGGNVEIVSDNAGVRIQNVTGSVKAELRRSDIVRAVNVKGPVEVKLDGRGRAGQDLELESIEGPVTVSGAFSGELNFRNLAKPLRFDSTQTELRVEKVPGTLRLALGNLTAENIQGPFRLSAKTRDVQLRDFTGGVDIQVDRGDIELHPAKGQMGKIEARTKNGEMDVVLPNGAKFDLTATTEHGEIINDYGPPLKAESEGRRHTLRGSTGGPSVSVTTHRGSLTVRKAGEGEPSKSVLPRVLEKEPPAPPKVPRVPAPVEQ
ncbi:MAG TPA: DUF4097 family beta strand repeat-containing protein [Bryobacteraceae bacterium]|nr:DUF4097 family beta strand repeat-containing protein [Bryobacteraceae bacterium]